MKTLKSVFFLAPAVSLGLMGGCSQSPSAAQAANAFFEAYNHLCEADALQAGGTLNLQGQSADYTASFTSSPQQLALSLFFTDNNSVGFYIKDGKTYLDYFGTRSSSDASKLGISADEPFHLPNPFLELSRQEREDLFSSVTLSEDTYTFTFKNSEMEKFLDNYGAVKVSHASMQATIKEGELTWMSIDVEGVYDIGTQSTDLSLQGDCSIEKIGEPVQVDFPADMNPQTWNDTASPSQNDLFSQALQDVESDSQENG